MTDREALLETLAFTREDLAYAQGEVARIQKLEREVVSLLRGDDRKLT